MNDILSKIIKTKDNELKTAKAKCSLDNIIELSAQKKRRIKNFHQAIIRAIDKNQPAIIAEIKHASPSKGIIRKNFNPLALAKSYQNNGATCLSVLTDKHYFGGDLNHLQQVAESTSIPVLRKDFIIDEYQIYQSYIYLADAILLIVNILNCNQLECLIKIAGSLSITPLLEVHNLDELDIAIDLASKYPVLIGINNRDLRTFKVDINNTIDLQQKKQLSYLISESGIKTTEDMKTIMNSGVKGFLIGEGLLVSDDPGLAMKKMVELI